VIVLLAGYALVEWIRPLLETGPPPVRLASKNFVEGEILTEIQKQMIEAHTGLRIEVVPYLSSAMIIKAIVNDEIDLYPEYTGNLLTNKDALDLPVPRDKSTITSLVRDQMRRRRHMIVLEPFGLNNTYAFCLKKSVARKYRLKTIGDLQRAPRLRIVVDLDFFDRPDGWQGMVKLYGLKLPPPQFVDLSLRYKTLIEDKADVALGYATDWEIDAYDLVILEDDERYFPNYHGVPVLRENIWRKHPELGRVLNRLKGQIDDETMRRFSKRVALDKNSVATVARDFLSERGLLAQERVK
jgi:glycine betaine/choline ABC-type transport system substrate-binding protein